jgi:hypothetical protein
MADYAQTASSVLASAQAVRLVASPAWTLQGSGPSAVPVPNLLLAGAAITAGQPVYRGTDSLVYPADANGADPLYKVEGIAENSAGIGQPVSVVVSDPAFTPGCTLAIGDVIVVSATAGKICEAADKTSGWFVSILGVAWSTTKMALNITRADAARA